MSWKSLYIYCHSIRHQEKLMLELETVINKMQDKWFFIKYWHGGPHLRLRMLNAKKEVINELENSIKNFFENNKIDNFDKEEYYKRSSFDGEDIDEETLPWYETGTWFYEKYVPEINRYGDGELLRISENIFQHSSEIALKVFKNSKDINKRLIFSSYLMYNFLNYNNALTYQFLDSYQSYWKTMVNNEPKVKSDVMYNIFDKIQNGDIKFDILDDQLDEIYKEFDNIRNATTEIELLYILSSQCHMMNNRISVTPEFEYIISKEMRDWIND